MPLPSGWARRAATVRGSCRWIARRCQEGGMKGRVYEGLFLQPVEFRPARYDDVPAVERPAPPTRGGVGRQWWVGGRRAPSHLPVPSGDITTTTRSAEENGR